MTSTFTRLTPINECKVIQVVEVKSLVGDGTHDSPIMEITEYFSLDGVRLARYVPTESDLRLGMLKEIDR